MKKTILVLALSVCVVLMCMPNRVSAFEYSFTENYVLLHVEVLQSKKMSNGQYSFQCKTLDQYWGRVDWRDKLFVQVSDYHSMVVGSEYILSLRQRKLLLTDNEHVFLPSSIRLDEIDKPRLSDYLANVSMNKADSVYGSNHSKADYIAIGQFLKGLYERSSGKAKRTLDDYIHEHANSSVRLLQIWYAQNADSSYLVEQEEGKKLKPKDGLRPPVYPAAERYIASKDRSWKLNNQVRVSAYLKSYRDARNIFEVAGFLSRLNYRDKNNKLIALILDGINTLHSNGQMIEYADELLLSVASKGDVLGGQYTQEVSREIINRCLIGEKEMLAINAGKVINRMQNKLKREVYGRGNGIPLKGIKFMTALQIMESQ